MTNRSDRHDDEAAEAERLKALRSYGVLDTAHEAAFDALVRVASAVCEAPVALVTLIDERRQWFLASTGLSGVTETPREIAFCAHAIREPDIMVVEDAALDPRFADNPLVVGDPHIRFYAGCRLLDRAGHALGTICVVGPEPRRLSPLQADVLRELSVAVVRLLEARKADNALRAAESAARTASADLAIVLDTTAAALITSQRRNELLMLAEEVANLGHWHIDGTSQAVYWSPQVYRIYGRDPATFMPTLSSSIDALHLDDAARVRLQVGQALERGEPFQFEARLLHSDGAMRRVQGRGQCELDAATGATRSVVGVLQDVTEQVALRERLALQDRLVTTGTLAAGVGHEINNPLTYVAANLEIALDALQVPVGSTISRRTADELIDVLGDAREGADRIRKIVGGLCTFARVDDVLLPTDAREAVELAADMAAHELRSRARVIVDAADMPSVVADKSRLSQVFVNLFTNAAQSFVEKDPEKNRIVVCARRIAGGRVSIEVEDNGPGIPADVLPRIFDPFFTTKPIGRGTGLGLAICHDIITSMGGEIVCSTSVGRGTTFRITLTAAASATATDTAAAGATASEPPSTPRMRSRAKPIRGRVLVIDDEIAVGRTIERALRDEHDVVTASDPREGLRLLLGGGPPFDLVFCDLAMPHLTGLELYEQVRAHDPSIADAFVFVTAGTDDHSVEAFLSKTSNECLRKPFRSIETLREMTRRHVAARRGRPAAQSA